MSELELVPLTDGAGTLRSLRESDLPTTLAWRNDEASRHWFHSNDRVAWSDHAAWFQRYRLRADDHVFILEIGGEPVAQVSLYDIADGSAEFGRLLVDPQARGRGAGLLASALCVQAADEVLELRSLHLEVKSHNDAAIRIYERLGFAVVPHRPTREGSRYMVRSRPDGATV